MKRSSTTTALSIMATRVTSNEGGHPDPHAGRRLAILAGSGVFLAVAIFLRRHRVKKSKFFSSISERNFLWYPQMMRRKGGGSVENHHKAISNSQARAMDSSSAGPNTYSHPEGPNIGPASDSCWFDNDQSYPEKTDLLHTGHFKGGKLLICVIGLPARGKTYIARKVARYLRWINYRTRVFCLARYRQDRYGHKQSAEFFDTSNEEYCSSRLQLLSLALEDCLSYLNRGGEVAFLDGSNVSKERRKIIIDRVAKEDGFEILWIESICEDPKVIEHNVRQLREASPDYVADHDFERRIEYYMQDYASLDEAEGPYAKVYDAGRKLDLHDIHGFLPTKIIAFLMNLHIIPRPVYFTRHGESIFNVNGLIGGDSVLSPKGETFAELLSLFIANEPELPPDKLNVWSSTMKRSRQTARRIKCARYVEWRSLREIEVGVCDGLSYEQVREKFPGEFKAREQDKLRYRYPRGESYLDVLSRLEPVIFELERQKAPVVIVAHQAVLRCLYAYFLDLPAEEVPYLAIPLHTVIKLTPRAYGCTEKRFKMLVDDASWGGPGSQIAPNT